MATRPTANTPRFSTSGPNTEPSSGKKAAGWSINERVPAQWLNWLQWSGGEWIDYFSRALSGEAVTDLAINAANPSASVPVIDVTTNADGASTQFKLLFRFSIGSVRHVSLYSGSSGSSRRWMLVQNARWNGTQWQCEDTSAGAGGIALRGGSATDVLELLFHAATASTWVDGAWANGGFTSLTAAALHVTGTGPGATATFDGPVAITGTASLTANNITADDVTASGKLTVAGDAIFNGLARFNTEFLYLQADNEINYDQFAPDPQPERKRMLPLCDGVSLSSYGFATGGYNAINGYLVSNGTEDLIVEYPLDIIPRDTREWSISAIWEAPDSAHANHITVFCSERDHDIATTSPAIYRVVTTLTQVTFDPTFPVTTELSAPITDEVISPALRTYFLRVFIKANAAGTNRLYSLRVSFRDPGPRNG